MAGSGWESGFKKKELSPGPESNPDWPSWRGAKRAAQIGWLPETLAPIPEVIWSTKLPSDGLAGLAVASGVVIASARDITDTRDVFVCVDAETGEVRWKHQYPAPGSFDYGNSSRSTPVISDDRVWTQGAAGDVHCLELSTGRVLWQRNIAQEFRTPRLEWGLTGSPLLIEGRLIVQPGGAVANVVALDAATGETVWQSDPGLPGHSSFVAATIGGERQLVGYDESSLGGWALATGKRLWGIVPRTKGDFNVPTPLIVGEQIVVATETNGTRAYSFSGRSAPAQAPVAQFPELIPDSSSPVEMNGRIYGLSEGLYCLDLHAGLAEVWKVEDESMSGYGSVIACPSMKQLLVMTLSGQLLLIRDEGDRGRIVSRQALSTAGEETHAHPAIVGDRLFARIGRQLLAVRLASK